MFDIQAKYSVYDISYIVCLSVRLGATLAIEKLIDLHRTYPYTLFYMPYAFFRYKLKTNYK